MRLWRPVTKREPCPVCDRPDWCAVSSDGRVARCMRVVDGPDVIAREDSSGTPYGLRFLDESFNPDPSRYRPDPDPPRAPDPVLHRVYSALLQALPLSVAHRAHLKARGLSDDAIDLAGYRTMPKEDAERRRIMGRLRALLGGEIPPDVPGLTGGKLAGYSGIVIPVREPGGTVRALKIRADDPHAPRYSWSSSTRDDGPSPGVPCHVPAIHVPTGSTRVIRVTEGPLKADIATALSGVLTLGLAGCTTVKQAVCHLRALKAEVVSLAWDADARENHHVAASLRAAVELFRAEGFAVQVETWDASAGKGIDDALHAGCAPTVHAGERVDRVVKEVCESAAKVRAMKEKARKVEKAASVAPSAVAPASADGSWRSMLATGRGGTIRGTFGNLCLILRHGNLIEARFNEMLLQVECKAGDSWRLLDEAVIGDARERLERAFGCEAASDNLKMALRTVAEARRVHPVREYLDGIEWDRERRIHRVGAEVLRAEPSPLTERKIMSFLVSAVARARRPGCQVDTVFTLVGDQGAHKSKFFRTLAGPWFADSHMDLTNKDAYLQLHSAWIYEWGEVEKITSVRRAEEVKAFLTSPHDTFRPPYGSAVQNVKRGNVLVGSTNEAHFLVDETGNRRWWPVTVPKGARIDLDALAAWTPQLWGEAVALYEDGYQWWLTPEESVAHESEVENHRVRDPWEDVIGSWLVSSEGWRRLRLEAGVRLLTTHVILTHAVQLRPREMDDRATKRCARVLKRLGLEPRRVRLRADEAGRWQETTGQKRECLRAWVRSDTPDEADDARPDDSLDDQATSGVDGGFSDGIPASAEGADALH